MLLYVLSHSELYYRLHFVFSELEHLLIKEEACQDMYTVVKYTEDVCLSSILKKIVNEEESKKEIKSQSTIT